LETTAQDGVDALVLNGDIYDFWLLPFDRPAPSFEQILTEGVDPRVGFDMMRFRQLLQNAAKNVTELHENQGNHDLWLSAELAEQALHNDDLRWTNDSVKAWGVNFMHGHQHTLFNLPVPGTGMMPIGYFVSRAVATYQCISMETVSALLTDAIDALLGTRVVDWVAIEVLRPAPVFRTLLRHILNTVSNHVNFSAPIVGVVAPDAIPLPGAMGNGYTLNHFVNDYGEALNMFVDKIGTHEAAKFIMADVDSNALNTATAAESVDESVVILGHTHVPVLEVVNRNQPQLSDTPDVLAVNAGAFVFDLKGVQHHSYVDLTIDDLDEDYPECYSSANGTDYRGRVHTTLNGSDCVAWGTFDRRYEKAFGSVAFCRNLGDGNVPWCRTGLLSWGACNVGKPQPSCPREVVRGPIKAEVFDFPDPTPRAVAVRGRSTGSRWKVTRALPTLVKEVFTTTAQPRDLWV
jgi:hypothetical protein